MKHYNPELLADPERWTKPSEDGYVMTEPYSGKLLNPTEVPEWLRAEPDLVGGLDSLDRIRNRLGIDVLFGAHGEAADLGDIAKGRFEARLKRADLYGYESILVARTYERLFTKIGNSALRKVEDTSFESFKDVIMNNFSGFDEDDFEIRLIRASALANLLDKTFSYDLRSDGTPTELSIGKAFAELSCREKDGATNIALHNAREWCMVARSGSQIRRTLGYLAFKRSSHLDYAMTIGSSHKDVLRKFRLQGFHPTKLEFLKDFESLADGKNMSASNARGIVTCDYAGRKRWEARREGRAFNSVLKGLV